MPPLFFIVAIANFIIDSIVILVTKKILKIENIYSKYKYLVYNIWMFYYYNPLIFDGCDDVAQEFSKALLNRDIKAENAFCDEFLKIRADLVKNNYDFWKSLETPYDFFFEIKKLYEEKSPEIVVVSKKNKAAVKAVRARTIKEDIPVAEVKEKIPTGYSDVVARKIKEVESI